MRRRCARKGTFRRTLQREREEDADAVSGIHAQIVNAVAALLTVASRLRRAGGDGVDEVADDRLLVGGDAQHGLGAGHVQAGLPGQIGRGIEAEAQETERLAHRAAHPRRVLANAAAEHQRVDAAGLGRERADGGAHARAEILDGKSRGGGGAFEQCAHFAAFAA